MHSSYIGSTVSLRCKGSLSFSFIDYTYSSDDRNPFSLLPPSCCSCCANSCIYRVPINPTFLYGFKQSTLIQCSPSKRLILGPTHCYSRFPICNIDRKCYYYLESDTLKERAFSGGRGSWKKGKYGCVVSEERGKRHRLGGFDDAEVILSLLSEEVGNEYFGVKERNVRSSRRLQVEKKRDSGEKKKVGSENGSHSKCEYESTTFQSWKEEEDKREKEGRRKEERRKGVRRKEEREKISRGENLRLRKEGSSSSYYSFSSSGEFENDTEVEIIRDRFERDSSSGYERNRKGNGEITYDGEVEEDVERHKGYEEERGVHQHAASSGVEGDWRKKSEKRLHEGSFEQAKLRKELSPKSLRPSEVQEGGCYKPSDLHKQFNRREEESSLAVNIDERKSQQYSQVSDQITAQSESRMKFKQFRETPEIQSSVIKTTGDHITKQNEYERNSQQRADVSALEEIDISGTSSFQKQSTTVSDDMEHHHQAGRGITRQTDSRGRSEQLTELSDTYYADIDSTLISQRKSDRITKQSEYKRNSQQLAEVSALEEIDIRGTSSLHRRSETVSDDIERHHQAGRRVTRQIDSRGRSEQLTGISDTRYADISDTRYADIDSTLISQRTSDTGGKKEENSELAFVSYPEDKEQLSLMGLKANRRMQSRKESQGITTHNDAEIVTNTQRVHEKRTGSQEKYATSAVKSVEEDRESHLTDERLVRIGSRKEAQRPTKMLNFREGISGASSSSQASLNLNPQSMVQQTVFDEGDERSSQATVIPPPSQLVAVDPSGLATTHKSQLEMYSGTRRDEMHGEPLNFTSEDVLGSADRFHKSSTRFIGEFVEKVRHEVSTSEVQKGKKTHETKFVQKDEEHKQKGQVEHDSRRSSRGSETKGPSDEMWDVNNPSIEEPPEIEAHEITTTIGTGVIKRTGRSLWGIIADIVKMRWSPRSESHNSKPGGKSSANQSTSSETWFSGHEADENNDENVKKENKSSSISSKHEIKHIGVDSLSSSNTESDSVLKGALSSSTDEVPAKKLKGTTLAGVVEPSSPLPAIRMRRSPVVNEISEASKTDAFVSGTMMQAGQPVPTGLTEEVSGVEGKDGELKRRKLQRNKQVPRDRFDEWEEAFTFETEQRKIDEMFMREALLEAKKAADMWEVPVGAVLVRDGKIIARGYNLVEELRDSTAHAEMLCIREASNVLQTWRLSETTLYVTLEPCPMCAGAILQARVDTVVWGAPNKLLGADGSWIRLFPNGGGEGSSMEAAAAPVHPFHPNITIRRGVLASECADAMQQFFQLRRRKKEKKPDSPPTPPSCLPIVNRPSKFFTKAPFQKLASAPQNLGNE